MIPTGLLRDLADILTFLTEDDRDEYVAEVYSVIEPWWEAAIVAAALVGQEGWPVDETQPL